MSYQQRPAAADLAMNKTEAIRQDSGHFEGLGPRSESPVPFSDARRDAPGRLQTSTSSRDDKLPTLHTNSQVVTSPSDVVESPVASPTSSSGRSGSSGLFSQLSSKSGSLKQFAPSNVQNLLREGVSLVGSEIDRGGGFVNMHTKRAVRTVDNKMDGQLGDTLSNVMGGGIHGYAAKKVTNSYVKEKGKRPSAPESHVPAEAVQINALGERQGHPPTASVPVRAQTAPAPLPPTPAKPQKKGKLKRLFG